MRKSAKVKHPRAIPTQRGGDDAERVPDMPFSEGAHDQLDPDLRHRLISDAAYGLYCRRGYVDGYDLDDWLDAEAKVDHVLLNPGDATSRPGTRN